MALVRSAQDPITVLPNFCTFRWFLYLSSICVTFIIQAISICLWHLSQKDPQVSHAVSYMCDEITFSEETFFFRHSSSQLYFFVLIGHAHNRWYACSPSFLLHTFSSRGSYSFCQRCVPSCSASLCMCALLPKSTPPSTFPACNNHYPETQCPLRSIALIHSVRQHIVTRYTLPTKIREKEYVQDDCLPSNQYLKICTKPSCNFAMTRFLLTSSLLHFSSYVSNSLLTYTSSPKPPEWISWFLNSFRILLLFYYILWEHLPSALIPTR